MPNALVSAWRKASQHMLRITIDESVDALEMKLEGRVAGPWAAELGRVWMDTAPRITDRKLVLDVSGVTYADAGGLHLLCEIYKQTKAELIAATLWAQSLADQITHRNVQSATQEF